MPVSTGLIVILLSQNSITSCLALVCISNVVSGQQNVAHCLTLFLNVVENIISCVSPWVSCLHTMGIAIH